jgi:fructose/tagatose bisphosphate aldolase
MQCGCKCSFIDGMVVMQEARAKDMISQLKLEMNNLTRLVEAGAGLSIGEESTMNELLKQKEDLTKERDAQVQPDLMSAQLWAVAFGTSAC